MGDAKKCPKCGSDLGRSGGTYVCWSSICDFRFYRPWITPPRLEKERNLSKRDEDIIKECIYVVAYGPFFVDERADEPYWEYPALFGFERDEIIMIYEQWPSVDLDDEYLVDFVPRCVGCLLSYPHGLHNRLAEYVSAEACELNELVSRLRQAN